ncbi:major facilitator superfamily protein [Halomonas elongata]|uniref:Major facilitator superfamily protein n=1 Tax=Halomonas elongata TaxID=2746 RepID=A0A1B8P0B7_HALEL|nr:MFS transporter [Halomonas elongata]OBX35711.1 major facilitator superfamily protein [Halomonas elongata]
MNEASSPRMLRDSHRYTALAIAAFTILTAGSFATLAGLLTTSLVQDLGWTIAAISPGVALNMVLYGAAAPFGIYAMEKYGIRRITICALVLLMVGALLPLYKSILVFNLAWGGVVGLGCGTLTMAYGALVARIWFEKTGLATGVLTASAVLGQFVLLPLWAEVAERYGWEYTLIGCSLLALITLVLNLLVLTEKKTRVNAVTAVKIQERGGVREVIDVLMRVVKSKTFWLIAIAFAICGATTNGLMWSSFIPAAAEHGLAASEASTVLLVIGLFNVPGTIFAGWASDRINQHLVLAFVFAARGATFLWLPLIWASELDPNLMIFGVLFGIFDVATVPPVINLCNKIFGERGPSVFSWINVFHQVGAGMIAMTASGLKSLTGTYQGIWLLAAVLCFLAIFVVFVERCYSKILDGSCKSVTNL